MLKDNLLLALGVFFRLNTTDLQAIKKHYQTHPIPHLALDHLFELLNQPVSEKELHFELDRLILPIEHAEGNDIHPELRRFSAVMKKYIYDQTNPEGIPHSTLKNQP